MSTARVRVAWLLFVLTVALAAVQVVILARAETPLISGETSDDGFPLVTLAAVCASAVGLLVVTRHPRHRVGWLFLAGQAGTMLGLTSQAYGFNALTDGFGSPSAAHVAMWVSALLDSMFALTLMALLLLLVPDGHLLSARWRWAVAVTLGGLLLHDGAVLVLVSPAQVDAEARVSGAPAVLSLVTSIGVLGIAVGLVAGASSLVIRLRRSSGDRRAQVRWIAAAAAGLAASVPLAVLVDALTLAPVWVALLPLMLAYLALPLCTGIAILRYRLFGIDVLVNRSISLAVLTAFVTVAYVAVVVVLGRLGGGSVVTSVLASVLVALAFQPLRRRVTTLADRLVYGAQAVPYVALAELNEELHRGLPVEALLARMAEATGRTLGAECVQVWIDQPVEVPLRARWQSEHPAAADDEEVFAVVDRGEPLGGLSVAMARGRGLRRAERDLLGTFADQLATAFRARRLESALAARVDLLASRRAQLERSRLRLLSAQSVERLRFESAIAGEVLPHLTVLPDDLRRLAERSGAEPWPASGVERAIQRVGRALDSLRTLTRGVFPAQLARQGLAAALSAHVERGGVRHVVEVSTAAGGRFPPEVESVAYFCAVELLRAFGGPTRVLLAADADRLSLSVAAARGPVDVEHLADRVEAAGGSLRREQSRDEVRVVVEIPVGSAPVGLPDGLERLGAEG